MMSKTKQQANGHNLGIFYEHPEWFKPLFSELDRREIAYERLLAYQHQYDPRVREIPYSLVVNRMSPSAFTRGHAHAIPYTLEYLAYLKESGANVLNGYDSYLYEFSKARQTSLLNRLGVPSPRAIVINHSSQALEAAKNLSFPLIIKPNIGGSGAGIVRFDSTAELRDAVARDDIDLGIDGIGLLQEYLSARGNSIVRVEILGHNFLYAIRLFLQSENSFNLCPADYCDLPENQIDSGLEDGVSGRGLLVEGYTPPQSIIQTVEHITRSAGIEVGGVEYLVNDLNGEVTYYDVNALSNFVADAQNVIGFDPFPRLVDYLLVRSGNGKA
jgi:hypothetical protein